MSKRKNTSNIYAIYSTMIVTCYLYVTFKKSPQYATHIKLIVGWEPEGRYYQWLCTAIAPFWFSKEHHWVLIMPFWLSAYDIHHIVRWEPEGRYCSTKMFRWEPEGRYRCTKSMAIVPFWFSTEHLWSAITPFWLSTDDIKRQSSHMSHNESWLNSETTRKPRITTASGYQGKLSGEHGSVLYTYLVT